MRRRGQHGGSAKPEGNGAGGIAISGESMQRLKRFDIYARFVENKFYVSELVPRLVYCNICMYGHAYTVARVWINRGKVVANPARGQLYSREN